MAQLIGFIAFFISLVTYHQKSKVKILSNALLVNCLKIVHYLLLGAYSACVIKVVAIIRDFFVILKEKYNFLRSKFFFWFFLLLYLVIAIVTYDGVFSLFPVIAAFTYILVIWNGDVDKIRKIAFLGYCLWLCYNIFVFSISGVLSDIISILSVSVAIYRCRENR